MAKKSKPNPIRLSSSGSIKSDTGADTVKIFADHDLIRIESGTKLGAKPVDETRIFAPRGNEVYVDSIEYSLKGKKAARAILVDFDEAYSKGVKPLETLEDLCIYLVKKPKISATGKNEKAK